MPDTFPPTTDSPALAALAPARRYTPSPEELARQAAAAEHLAQVAAMAGLTPEEYAKSGSKADQQYDVHHLDVDSVDVLPDCQFISYLPGPAGGQP